MARANWCYQWPAKVMAGIDDTQGIAESSPLRSPNCTVIQETIDLRPYSLMTLYGLTVTRNFHSDSLLGKCVGDVLYEHDMFEVAIVELDVIARTKGAGDELDPRFQNAWVEVYLLHCRSLIYFLCCVRSRKDDLIASDFVEQWSAADLEAPLIDCLGSLNKRLFHLSTYRADRAQGEKDLAKWQNLADPLRVLWMRFCAGLSPNWIAYFETISRGDSI
jgi:hypothetical protein